MKGLKPDPGALVNLAPPLAYVLDNYLEPDEALRDLPVDQALELLSGTRPVPLPRVEAGRIRDGLSGRQEPSGLQGGGRLDKALARLADLAAERLEQVAEAQAEYEDSGAQDFDGAGPPVLPSDSRVVLEYDDQVLHLAIPRAGILNASFLAGGFFALMWLGFVAFWTFMALAMGAPLFFPLFSLPFWAVGIFLVKSLLQPALSRFDLSLSREGGVLLTEEFIRKKVRHWPLGELGACSVKRSTVTQKGRTDMELVLELGTRSIRFGRSLSPAERRVIARIINAWRKS